MKIKYEDASQIIGALISGAVARRRLRTYLFSIPRILIFEFGCLKSSNSKKLLSADALRDSLYIMISVFGFDGILYSRYRTKSVSSLASNWRGHKLVCINGGGNFIVLNVISSNPLRSDTLVGQAILDLSSKNESTYKTSHSVDLSKIIRNYLPGEAIPLELKLSYNTVFPLEDCKGNIISSNKETRSSTTILHLKVVEPSQFTSMCGWFILIHIDIHQVKSFHKVWVVLYNSTFRIYSNTLDVEGELIRKFNQSDIMSLKQVNINVSDSKFDFLSHLGGFHLHLAADLELWAWTPETYENRGMWIRNFVPNVY